MKTLYFTFNMLRALLRRNTFMCVLLFIGTLACNLMFIYTYGAVAASNLSDGVPEFFMSYDSGELLSVDDVSSKLGELDDASIYYYVPVDASSSTEMTASTGVGVDGYLICASDAVTTNKTTTGDAEDLSEPETVIVPDDFASVKVGDVITFNGCELRVAGTAVSLYYYVSVETFENCGFTPVGFAVDVPYRDVDYAEKIISDAIHDGYVTEKTETELGSQGMKDYMLTFLIFLLSIVSFVYMFVYISEENAREYAIYELVGAKRKTILLSLSLSAFVILCVSTVFAVAFHAAFYDSFFVTLIANDEFFYKASDYAMISFTSLTAVYAVITVYINLRMKGSTLESIRRTLK